MPFPMRSWWRTWWGEVRAADLASVLTGLAPGIALGAFAALAMTPAPSLRADRTNLAGGGGAWPARKAKPASALVGRAAGIRSPLRALRQHSTASFPVPGAGCARVGGERKVGATERWCSDWWPARSSSAMALISARSRLISLQPYQRA